MSSLIPPPSSSGQHHTETPQQPQQQEWTYHQAWTAPATADNSGPHQTETPQQHPQQQEWTYYRSWTAPASTSSNGQHQAEPTPQDWAHHSTWTSHSQSNPQSASSQSQTWGDQAAAGSSSSTRGPPPDRPTFWDQRDLRGNRAGRPQPAPVPTPWVEQLRDGRQVGKRPTPAPAPPPHRAPTPQPEHTELMQRSIHPAANNGPDRAEHGGSGGAPTEGSTASTAGRLEADSLALAVSHQIQLIHDAAGSLGGGPAATVTAFCDVAAHLLAMMYPTGIVPDTCKRGRKRAICSANYLVDAFSSFTHHLHGGGRRLTREEWQQDLSYLIRVLEEGAIQLHEPMAATVSLQQLQWGTRCLQRAIMLLTAALDSSLRGECCWNTPKLWGNSRT